MSWEEQISKARELAAEAALDWYEPEDETVIDVSISKRDEDAQQVFGWASVVSKDGKVVLDSQKDIIPIEELEKAAYDYVLREDGRVGGVMHERVEKFGGEPRQASRMIESMVFTPEKIEKMGLPSDFPQGWWTGYQVDDPEVWSDIKKGKHAYFSIHGRGRRTPFDTDTP